LSNKFGNLCPSPFTLATCAATCCRTCSATCGQCERTIKIEEKLLWRAYRKWPTLFRFFGSPPYFYFRFRLYGHRDGRFCLIFARTAQKLVLDDTDGLPSFKPCVYCRIVHRADVFAIAQLLCLYSYLLFRYQFQYYFIQHFRKFRRVNGDFSF